MNSDFLEPDFIQIPFQLVKDKELEQVDRLLYGIVYWFEHLRDGRCFAGNDKLAKILGTTPRVIQNSLTNLESRGYIRRLYKDSAKRNRLEIQSLIAFKLLSPVGDRHKTNDPQVIDVSPTGDRASDPQVTRERIGREKNEKNTVASQSSAEDIVKVIDLFREVNSAAKRWYANTTQRAAVDRLLVEHGIEKIERVIPMLAKTNTMPYFPSITTALQLEEKWAALSGAMIRKKSELQAKKTVLL